MYTRRYRIAYFGKQLRMSTQEETDFRSQVKGAQDGGRLSSFNGQRAQQRGQESSDRKKTQWILDPLSLRGSRSRTTGEEGSVRSVLLVVGAVLAFTIGACHMPQTSETEIKVAGGSLTTDFGATYYARIETFVGGAPSGDISNVATLLDVGAPNHKILLVSLADAFRGVGPGQASGYLPVIDELSIRLFGDSGASGQPVLSLERLHFQRDGKLTGQIPVVFIGASLERVPGTFVSRLVASQVQAVGSRVVDPSPLKVGNLDLRNAYSSFVMIALPNQMVGTLTSARFVAAESRPAETELAEGQLSMVGFGNMSKLSETRSVEVTQNQMRNAAPVKPLNLTQDGQTPIRALTASSAQATQQIWEVEGGGICGSRDGKDFDTGAAIYYRAQEGGEWQFVGFVSRSSSKSGGFLGTALCDQVAPADMASLVISPSQNHVAKITSQL